MNTEIAEPRGGASRGPVPLPKIQVPARAGALVTRPRLLDDVAPSVGRHAAADDLRDGARVTLLCGPAGSGKTTLLVDWARHRRRDGNAAVAWVSLGPDDNDVFVLWSAVLGALEATGAFPPATGLRELRAPRHKLDAAFTAAFVGAFRKAARRPVYLVLDDVHEVDDTEALASLDVLLRNAPPQLHVLLSTRYAPPLALPKLRLEGRVRDIDRTRLSFTEAEADALLRLHGVQLAAPDLALLLDRTEGWAAGLRLAAMSLLRSSERAQLIADFAGDHRAVADYLIGEVLERQQPEILEFLLDTSICEQLTADLARRLSGREDAGALLDELERTNSFITGLGHGWYRYHPMLRQYLRAELSRRRHHHALELHRTASDWFEARGDTLAAVEHAAEAEDDELLSALLVGHALRHVTMGEAARVRRVLRRATATTRRSPTVAAVAALTAMDVGDVTAARDLVAVWPPSRLPGAGDGLGPVVPAARDVVTLEHACAMSDADTVRDVLERGAPVTGEPDLDMLVHLSRGEAWLWLGEPGLAAEELGVAQALGMSEHRPWLTLQASVALAATHLHAGDVDAADVAARDAVWLAGSHGWDQSPPATRARVTLGWVAYHRMDDQAAQTQSGVIAGASGRATSSLEQLGPRLLTAFARYGAAEDRRAIVQEVRDLWRLRRSGRVQPQLVAVAAVAEQSLALAVGEGQWAVEVVERTRRVLGETGEVALLRAVIHAYRGRARAARQALAPILRGELATLSPLTDLEAWLWEARLAQRLDDGRRAASAIGEAVSRAAPGQVMRPFQRGGDEVHELLSRTSGTHGHHELFVTALRSLVAPAGSEAEGLLTTRELELLAELPSLRTAEEIADSMYLSVNTVKTHIRGIYRKLGVNNRRDAVESARVRGLL
jgi:LuxR family maltose regulon positive regulatory protein